MTSLSKIALCVVAAFSTALSTPLPVLAQTTVSTHASVAQPGELQQLAAPIALYPDALLSQVLMASTYPLEVVEAARWRQAHPNLEGGALEAALQNQDWDPSVKSLVAFPNVLDMMNDRISWTTRLGDVFLTQQNALMDQVQELRSRAQAAGNLKSGPEQTVVVTPASAGPTLIRIEPARPEVVFVPVYNPMVVYGPWLYPAYQPFYWYPPNHGAAGAVFSFGVGLLIGHALWGGYDWHAHRVHVLNVHNYNNFNRTRLRHVHWHHDPYHRRNVAYRDPGRAHHQGHPASHFAARESYRAHADALRRELPRVDRASLRERGGHDLGNGGAPGNRAGRSPSGQRMDGGPGQGRGPDRQSARTGHRADHGQSAGGAPIRPSPRVSSDRRDGWAEGRANSRADGRSDRNLRAEFGGGRSSAQRPAGRESGGGRSAGAGDTGHGRGGGAHMTNGRHGGRSN